VLAYSHENAVEPFLEPVVGLCQALLDKDQQDMHRNMDGERACIMRIAYNFYLLAFCLVGLLLVGLLPVGLLLVSLLPCGNHMLSLAAQTHTHTGHRDICSSASAMSQLPRALC